MIGSFADKRTAAIFHRVPVRSLRPDLLRRARAKLLEIDAAGDLDKLGSIPGHRLETLRGDRRGQYSIRINRQWRVCFRWRDGQAHEVEIVDYH